MAPSSFPSDRSRSPSIPVGCGPGTASCIGSSLSRSSRCRVWRCDIARRASAHRSPRPLGSSMPRSPVATWWRRGFRCRSPRCSALTTPGARSCEGQPLAATLELHLAWDEESVSIAGTQRAARERADGRTGAHLHRRTDRRVGDTRAAGTTHWSHGGSAPARVFHALPARARPRGLRAWHGSSPVRWAEMYNRLLADPGDPQPVPVLVLPVRLRKPDRALGAPPARGPGCGRGAARPRREGPGSAPDGADRAQPGGPARQDAEHQQRRSDLELRQPEAARPAEDVRYDPRPVPARDVRRARARGRLAWCSSPRRSAEASLRRHRIIANLTRRLAILPFALTGVSADIARNRDAAVAARSCRRPSTTCRREHPFIRALQEIPVSPAIKAHSIIAVEGDGPDRVMATTAWWNTRAPTSTGSSPSWS